MESRARSEGVLHRDSAMRATSASPTVLRERARAPHARDSRPGSGTRWTRHLVVAVLATTMAPLVARAQTTSGRAALSRSDSSLVERDSLTVFRRELEIGVERYELRRDGGGLALHARIAASTRGTSMPVDATFRTDTTYGLRQLRFRGAINAWTLDVERSVDVVDGVASVKDGAQSREVRLPQRWYALPAHVPASAQQMLLRYWLARGRPDSIAALGGGAIVIRDHGADTLTSRGARLVLRRYSVAGVTWAREVLWVDDSTRLFALAANTAGIAYRFVRRGHEDALPRLMELALEDQLRSLAQLNAGIDPVAEGTVAIVGGRLIDGTGRPPIDDAVVVVREGRIVEVGRRASVPVPAGARVIDARGGSILPGLWDMHAKYGTVEWGPAYLGGGVTTVRDLNNVLEFATALRDSLDAGRALGPRMLLAGLVDGHGPDANGDVRVGTPDEARSAVRLYHEHRFQQLKLYNLVPPALVPILTAEAHRLGMTVTGHVPRRLDAVQAVAAGMDGIEHIGAILRAMVSPDSLAAMSARGTPVFAFGRAFVPTAPEALRVARSLVQSGTVIAPTLALLELFAHGTDLRPESIEPAIANPPQGMDWLRPAFAGTPADTGDARKHFLGALEAVRMLHAAGATIVAGTDIGVPVHSLHRELELFVEAGFSPMEAIQAATSVPSRVMGMQREVGTIEPGKRADLIVVDGDPLRDIRAIRRVRQVMTTGRLYETAPLWRGVGFRP